MLPLILASASPRREFLLREMGLTFTVVRPENVEELTGGLMPEILATHNAQRKARAVAAWHPHALVLGADTIVVLDGVVYGKPTDRDAAARMLSTLAGRAHEVFTGVCLATRGDRDFCFCERTKVWMQALSAEQIRAYHAQVNPLDKAGAYGAQEFGATIIERIDGSFSNVMGLPVERLRQVLEQRAAASSS